MAGTKLRKRHFAALTAAGSLAMLAFAMLGTSHGAPQAQGNQPPVLVTSVPVQTQTVPLYLSGVGVVQPLAAVTVHVRVDGQLEKVFFSEGQTVKAGQKLAQIDARSYAAQLAQAEAQKARDAAQLANAHLDWQRYSTLAQQDAVSQQTLATQKALVDQLAAAVQTDDAAIKLAQVNLSYTTIYAPQSGRLGARLVDPGNIVHATDTGGLVQINQINPINVLFTLPEDAVGNINQAMHNSHKPLPVLVYARSDNSLLASGDLVLLNNQIDTTSGTVQLKGRFANGAQRLWPGQYVNARLVLQQQAGRLTVPETAVQRGPDGMYVFVIKPDQTAVLRPVQLDRMQDGLALINSGLHAGERVVVDGQYKLKPGSHVKEAAAKGAGK